MHRAWLGLFSVSLTALTACGPLPEADDASDVEPPPAAPAAVAVAAAPVMVAAVPPVGIAVPPCTSVPIAPCYILAPQPAPPPVVIATPPPAPAVVVPTARPVPSIHPRVRAVLRRHHGKIRRCYDKGLRHDPSLEGRVVVRMVVDSDGEVDNAFDAGSTLPDREVVECIVEVLEDIDFHGSVGRSIVYPIDLQPGWR